ncbi:hypothetical protein CHARACLAT_002024 [Characodon lateralis]|uniref:Uncharacterized protein n=1 Tax=Characodon lateralis TaxID=208331 RepID=A0ABU7F027_9TELE|nr:hypothetical protein [Characodon lateralis]
MLRIYVTEFLTLFLEVILDDQAYLRSEDSYPVFCFCLDSYQAGSFRSSPSPEPSHKRTLSTLQREPPHIELVSLFRAHTEQHQVNSLRIYLLKTWILNLIPPGDLTTITHSLVNHHPTPRPKETTDPWSAEVSFFAPDSTLKMKGKRTAEDRRQEV